MSNPRIAFRIHPLVEAALQELAEEQAVDISALLRHGAFLVLAGVGRLPEEVKRRKPGMSRRSSKPLRVLANLQDLLPIVDLWPELIPDEIADKIATYGK